MRTCGDCTYCCKVVAVTELDKPPGVWCQHCDIGHGCKIYAERPGGCRAFECFWLQSGNWDESLKRYRMPDEMRPDRVHAVFGGNRGGTKVMLYLDPATPDIWRTNRLVYRQVEALRKKHSVAVVCGDRRILLPAYTLQGRLEAEALVQLKGMRGEGDDIEDGE
jgi:uncharacterized protein